jgi:hypothetical protein
MPDPLGPLAHVPDPNERFQVFGFVHGELPVIEVIDAVSRTGVVMDLLAALQVAADINREAIRLIESVGDETGNLVDLGEVDKYDPRWQREMWRRSPNGGPDN